MITSGVTDSTSSVNVSATKPTEITKNFAASSSSISENPLSETTTKKITSKVKVFKLLLDASATKPAKKSKDYVASSSPKS